MCADCTPRKEGIRTFGSGYFDEALMNLPRIIQQAQTDLRRKKFDTLVGTGVSGTIVVPALALAMDKHFLIVRKDNDGSHHGGNVVGTLGKRWVFLDDFVSSGETRVRVWNKVQLACDEWRFLESEKHQTTLAGEYMYSHRSWMNAAKVRADQKAKDDYRAEAAARREAAARAAAEGQEVW